MPRYALKGNLLSESSFSQHHFDRSNLAIRTRDRPPKRGVGFDLALDHLFYSNLWVMDRHEELVAAISVQVRQFYEEKTPFRIYHGSTNSTRQSKYRRDELIDTASAKDRYRD